MPKPVKNSAPTTLRVSPPESEPGSLKRIGGSMNDAFNNIVANQAIKSLWVAHSDSDGLDSQYQAVLAAMMGIEPHDEIEGMLAVQMVATHNAAMECFRRDMLENQTFEGHRENLNQANKLTRSYATLMEALNRHRGKGQQRVTVEHVHVHQGGQAVVGTVEHPGGGHHSKSEEQPHAKQITHAPEPPMWSADTGRSPVPVAGDAERPLPNAWRGISGSTEWQ